MKILVLIHVLSAIIGVGPTFFAHVLLRKKQTLEELRMSLVSSYCYGLRLGTISMRLLP
jgi:uncharacterized membrane protein